MRLGKLIGSFAIAVIASVGFTEVAEAGCSSTGANQITCTGGDGASVVNGGGAGTVHATTYPATLAVSGAPAGATVASLVLRLNGYTTLTNGSADVGIVLEGPLSGAAKPNLQVIRGGGTGSTHQTNTTVALQDGATQIPDLSTPWTGTGTWAPTARDGTARDGETSPTYTPTGPSAIVSAAPLGTSTLASVFAGKNVLGTWNVYLANDSGNLFGLTSNVSFTSFDLIINYTVASAPSTTTLTPNPTTAYTSAANSSVVLTANVTAGATGTVTFKDSNTVLSCSGANPATLSGGSATCATSFAAEGLHVLSAVYSGDSTFVTSSGSANVYIQNHSANVGTTYCNTGSITATGTSDVIFSSTTPYPSVIFVGDGTNTNLTNSVNTLSLTLKNFSAPAPGTLAGVHMLLVAPDGAHAYDFFSNTGNSASAGNYTFQDGATQVSSGPISPGTYGPTADGPPPDAFTPGPPAPAPQVPGSFVYASPVGSSTFQTAFSGAAASGAWKLFLYNSIGSGINATAAGGWCLTISEATGHPTTTVVTSSASPNAALGASVSFQATVASSPTPTVGNVTFTENGSPLTGAPNGGVATVVNGLASISTSGLLEGDHTITASYHDSTSTFNDSFGTVTIRVDKTTSTPTLSGSTWSYCNTGVVTIPAGTITLTDIGPAGPNPSNVLVSNMPGTISSVSIKLNGFSHFHPVSLQSLLVGPNGASSPTTAQTFDFFTNAGGINAFGPQTTTFTDASAAASSVSPPAASSGPASYGAAPTFTASPFFTLPGTFQRATTAGAFTFNTGTRTVSAGGVYLNTDPNGAWSLYFDQTTHQAAGGGMTGGWCVNFISNPVTGAGTTSHTGPAPGNHMKQGGTGTVTLALHNNGDSNSQGSAADPDGNHGMVVTGTVPAGLTLGTVPTGTPWACVANTSTTFTCKSSNAIAAGSNYPGLILPVSVGLAAPVSVTVSGVTFSGAGMTAGTSSSDTITIDPAPVLSMSKTHSGTFTQGQNATWNLTVQNNAATASGTTDGSTVTVIDSLPAGYTVVNASGTNWSCSGNNTVTCTSNQVIAGNGGQFPIIQLIVAVPGSSATSVTNSAGVFGGGDLTHTNSGNAAAGSDTVTVVQVPAIINLTAGANNQSATVNTAFATPLSVTVLDAGNVAINGVTVTFTAPASGASGTFAGGTNVKTAVTNASGLATATTYTANAVPGGPYNVSVAAGLITNNFSETNVSGTATQMTANAGTTPQSATISTAFANALAVTVKDGGNNPVSGVNVTFTAPNSGASGLFSNSTNTITVPTNASGIASAPFTANATAGGPYTVTAAATGLTTVNFSLTNSGGVAPPTVVAFKVLWGSTSYNVTGSPRNRLPWQITGIQVIFSAPITTGDVNSLGGVTPTGFFGLGTNTLTWTINPISIGQFTATLAGSGPDALTAVGSPLGGGAGASQLLRILNGDYNDDGAVNALDQTQVLNVARGLPYDLFADMNGDGIVNTADVLIVHTQIGNSLP